MNQMTISGAVFGAVALILGIAGIAVPKWLVLHFVIGDVTIGLWSVCVTFVGGSVRCITYTPRPDWVIATSAFEVIGICWITLAVLVAILHVSVAKNNRIISIAPGPFAFAGGICMVVGVIVWAAKYKNESVYLAMYQLSVGFILAIISAVLSIIAGILLFLGWRAECREHPYSTI